VSTFDDGTEVEFFEEPETLESPDRPRRRIRPTRPSGPRRPSPPPPGAVALARLAGLVALAIVIVVGFVFWVGSCQGKSKHDEYKSYADNVRTIATASTKVGRTFANELLAPGLKQSDLETKLQQFAQQEQQSYAQAQQIRAPGPLRALHRNLVDAIELRAKGLAGLGDALARSGAAKDQTGTAAKLSAQGELLTASDVVWEQLYRAPATLQLQSQGVKGVVIPGSPFVANPDIVSARSFALLMQRLGGASTGGTPTGKHGDGLISVRVTPQGSDLSTSSPTTVKVSADLSFVATVENSGDFQETAVKVTLTIDAGGTPIKKLQTIPLITAGERKTVTFTGFELPSTAFGTRATVTVTVVKVPGEVNLDNNRASYPVFFTLS